jgi:hypothetical protein
MIIMVKIADSFKEIMKIVRDNSGAELEAKLGRFTKKQIIDFVEEMKGAGAFSEMAQMYADYCEVEPDDDEEEPNNDKE